VHISFLFLFFVFALLFHVAVVAVTVFVVVDALGAFQGYKMIMGVVITLQRLLTREKIGVMFTL
jgi:hypothetical protein